jgi:hypothetical protein
LRKVSAQSILAKKSENSWAPHCATLVVVRAFAFAFAFCFAL